MLEPSSDVAGATYRRKVWTKIITLITLAAVVWLQPRITAWLEARKADSADNSGSVVRHDSNPSETRSRTRAVIRGVDAPVVAEVDDSEPPSNPVFREDKTKSSEPKTTSPAPHPSSSIPSDTHDGDRPSRADRKNQGSDLVRLDQDPATRPQTAGSNSASETTTSDAASTPSEGAQPDGEPVLGQLREIRSNVFESTAGLRYVPGSADSHRLRHVMQHAKNDLSKPKHGVFEGNRDEILAVIDEAYEKALMGGKDVRKRMENNRLVYIVNLGRKIGYAGGSEGERQGNPDCRYVQLVLEDENVVITAYPTKSF